MASDAQRRRLGRSPGRPSHPHPSCHANCFQRMGRHRPRAGRRRAALTLRKGVLPQAGKPFRLAHERFFLYPTFDHQPGDLVRESHQPELRRALEEGVWSDGEPPLHTFVVRRPPAAARPRADPRLGRSQRPLHGRSTRAAWTRSRRSTCGAPTTPRSAWAGAARQPLHVLLLRTYRIPRPVTVKVKDEYTGPERLDRAAARTPLRGHPGALRRRVRARLRGDPRDHHRRRPAGPGLGLESPRRAEGAARRVQRFARRLDGRLGHQHVARAGDGGVHGDVAERGRACRGSPPRAACRR